LRGWIRDGHHDLLDGGSRRSDATR
jgi:hypothetical protein